MIGLETIPEGQRTLIWNIRGEARYVDGPQRLFLFREKTQPLIRHAAEPHQYLEVKRRDGEAENIAGPETVWFNPLEHSSIVIKEAVKLDANEALVVYRNESEKVIRRIVRGPALFVPRADEWIHQFRWHGSDAQLDTRKVPRGLKFEKLRVIPDQMYFDVENVRTSDDALVVIKLMVFFELVDIELMLDQTHDPVADFINAMSADVIDFVGAHEFDQFKAETDALNDLAHYKQLVQRAEGIGYKINKVVYRGYYASEKLQAMHDDAIECRTGLRLEAETERQAQELADMKLKCEQERSERQRKLEETSTRHQIHLKELEEQTALDTKRKEGDLEIALQKEKFQLEINHQLETHAEEAKHFNRLKEL
ncbi:MAG: hypothetical protein AAF571_14660, partial [Verrucomicrobiota bacterium]